MHDGTTLRRDRQVVRLLAILKTLLEGGRPTVYQLAARFKTRRETIYRDLRALQDVGYPIEGDEQGRLSRPRLAAGFRPVVPPVVLNRQELAALVWSAKRATDRQPFRAALDTALPKLQGFTLRADERIPVALEGALDGWERGTKDYAGAEQAILRLVQAIVERRRLRVEYQAPGREKPNRFPYDPYRLLHVQGGLYCVGRVPAYPNLATLAVDRIRGLTATEESFSISPQFDPKRHEAEAFGVVWEKPITVVLRFRADQAPYVREREWHPSQRFHTLKNGQLEMTFHAGGTFEITRWILGWGDTVEVVRPASLRDRVAKILAKASGRYR
jgi:predicted DNA-binding transcriptional regulator YafY